MGFSCWGYLEAGRDSRLWALSVRVHAEFVIYSGRFTCCIMADTFQIFPRRSLSDKSAYMPMSAPGADIGV